MLRRPARDCMGHNHDTALSPVEGRLERTACGLVVRHKLTTRVASCERGIFEALNPH